MTDQELVFNALKREGECWHRSATGFETSGISFRCLICNKLINRVDRPDFSTPDGFFWMWERLLKQKWMGDFWDWTYDKAHEQYYSLTGKKMPQAWYWMTRFTGETRIENNLINPTALYNAVLEWVKEKKT